MTYNELKEVFASCNKEDWLFDDKRGVYTYKQDLNLRIVRKDTDFDTDKFAGEEWATNHPDPAAYREEFEVFYGNSFVFDQLLIAVDGLRARLPLPRSGTNKVRTSEYKFAMIVDQNNSLDDYMGRARLEIEE